MSLRGLLVLVVLLAAAVGALVWIDHRGKAKPVESEGAPLLPAFTEEGLSAIELACEGSSITLRHEAPHGWRMAQPFAADADPRRVHELIAAVQDARVRKVISAGTADLPGFGLQPAACTVRLAPASGGAGSTLRLGRSSPVGTERYAAGDDGRVVFADGSLYTVLSRGAETLRDKRLFPVEAEAITRIEIDQSTGRLALARTDGAWRVESPLVDAASASACASLARALTSLEVTRAATSEAPSHVRPERCIRIAIAAASTPETAIAYVAAAGIDGQRLSWRDGGALAGLLTEAAVRELSRDPMSFRDTRIATFSTPDVRRVSLDRGEAHLTLTRAGGSSAWAGLAGPASIPVDASRVDALLDRLRGLTSSGFTAAAPGAATGTIVVTGEKGELARLTYGPLPPEAGSNEELLWLTTPARPGVVFKLPAAHVGPIPARASDLAPAPPLPPVTAGGS